MRVDAHQHYWQLARGDYDWLTPEFAVLYRDYMPDDLEPFLRQEGFDKTIVVQAAPTIQETFFLLRLAEQTDSIAGVVGWLDFEGDFFAEQLDAFRGHPKFVGVRIMLQDREDPAHVLRPRIVERMRCLADIGLPVDLLVREHQLPSIAKLAELVPRLRAVIDHIAKPDIAARSLEPWKQWMETIASCTDWHCKLSGMVTEAKHESWTPDDFEPYVAHALRTFGTKRLMYGSDWPVCLLAATYAQASDIAHRHLAHLSVSDKEAVFGHNAAKFYGITWPV